MSYLDDDSREQDEHECPTPLERPVGEYDVGGMFFTPAGRWETITDRTPYSDPSAQIHIHTDRTGDGYAWIFWRSDRMPYVPSWVASRERGVVINEYGNVIEASIANSVHARGYGSGHALVSAHMVRGSGWQIVDRPGGGDLEQVEVPSKARARTEVARRARVHAKALGLPVWREGAR